MTLMLVIIGGIAVLMVLVANVGASMDTESHRRRWQRVAAERRIMHSEGLTVLEAPEFGGPLCDRCPYRRDEDD
ncbi:MAG: hypothetical protein ACR2GH_18985 [Pseudonocardia sp.]